MKVEALMKFLRKTVYVLLSFVLLYGLIMAGVYHFIFPYPTGVLDEMERDAGALTYRLMIDKYLDKDSLLYFSRSKNGGGDKAHVGTFDSDLPHLLANFKCTATSDVYIPMDCYGVLKTNNADNYYIIYGATRDENTVNVKITFYVPEGDEISYRIPVEDHFFYFVGAKEEILNYESRILGLNAEEGITFEYSGEALVEPNFIAKYQES